MQSHSAGHGTPLSTSAETCVLSRNGSCFKLTDGFNLETEDPKQEMVQMNTSFDRKSTQVLPWGLEGEPRGVLRARPPTAICRLGFHVLPPHMNVLEKLMKTHPVWLQLSLSDEEAARILQAQLPGTFIVRSSRKLMKKVISLRMDDASQEPVQDFPVQETQYTFSLEGSAIVFDNLVHMVAFYCVSRDLLPFTLRLPKGIAAARTSTDLQAPTQLGAGFWDSALCNQEGLTGDTSQQDRQTAAAPQRPALCFLHPLFPGSCPFAAKFSATPSSRSLPSRLPTEHSSRMPAMTYWIREGLESDASASKAAALGPRTPLSAESCIIKAMLERCQTKGRSVSCPEEGSRGTPYAAPEVLAYRTGWLHESDQRLSDISMSTTSSGSVDLLDSYTNQSRAFGDSSMEDEEDEDEAEENGEEEEKEQDDDENEEEEEDYTISMESSADSVPQPSNKSKKRRTVTLPLSLRSPLRSMSGALDSLMAPERRAVRRVQRLSRDKTSYFGCLVQDYVSFVQEEHRCHLSSLDLLQTLRQFLTQTKAYLAQSSELEPPIHSLVPENHIDPVLEKAMHKSVLKPLKDAVLTALQEFQEKSGEWQQLKENLAQAKSKTPQDLGVDPATVVPDPITIEKIRNKFHTMFKMYSPDKKVSILLQICKIIYTIMKGNSEGEHGADNFLPMLTYVLAQCDLPQLDLEIQYMMELLDPSQLQGEGGYYLTSAYAAMSVIKTVQEEQAVQVVRSQTQDTLKQWHRRRTAESRAPVIEDLQNYLRVVLQDPDSGCTAKTLQVSPFCSTRDICQLCANKFQVQDPESHALFLLTEGGAQQLEPDTLLQMIKVEMHNHPHVLPFHFVYRPVNNLNLCE